MKKLKNLPIDVSTFSKMIEKEYLYIDKTQHIYNLYSKGANYHFLSRPRRFGKSLLISTLAELFAGNKKLFKGLWIDSSDWEWNQHPVIHLDFSKIEHRTEAELVGNLVRTLEKFGQERHIDLSSAITPGAKLEILVDTLAKKEKVVILIDEYDKPIIDHITNFEAAEESRLILKSFYDVIKGLDANLRAVFITGVSKFSKTSIFSGINNLNDISQKPQAASLLGYTQQELESFFAPYIVRMATAQNRLQQEIFDEMKEWYNGYRFCEEEIRVYNPFSVLYYLNDQKLRNYWISSGNPEFFIQLLRMQPDAAADLDDEIIINPDFQTFDVKNIMLIPLLYQTGYLTIQDAFYQKGRLRYKLDYPNLEIRESFTECIVVALAYTNGTTVNTVMEKVKKALAANDLEKFCLQLRIMLAHIPYFLHIKEEHYYHSLIKAFMYALNFEVHAEVITNKGRIDLVITIPQRIFIIEIKFNKTPEMAMKQIHETKYYEKYLAKDLPITLAGISINYQEGKELTLDFVQELLDHKASLNP